MEIKKIYWLKYDLFLYDGEIPTLQQLGPNISCCNDLAALTPTLENIGGCSQPGYIVNAVLFRLKQLNANIILAKTLPEQAILKNGLYYFDCAFLKIQEDNKENQVSEEIQCELHDLKTKLGDAYRRITQLEYQLLDKDRVQNIKLTAIRRDFKLALQKAKEESKIPNAKEKSMSDDLVGKVIEDTSKISILARQVGYLAQAGRILDLRKIQCEFANHYHEIKDKNTKACIDTLNEVIQQACSSITSPPPDPPCYICNDRGTVWDSCFNCGKIA